MSSYETRDKKTLKDRAEELVRGVLEAIENLVPAAQPALVPVRVRTPRPRRLRR